MKRIGMLLILLTLAVAASGCWIVLAGAAGATGVYYMNGVAEKSYPYAVEKTYDGVLAALKDGEITPYQKGFDATSGTIEATLADGKKLKIELKAMGDNVTRVRLRIGTFGDKDRSAEILAKIDKRLG